MKRALRVALLMLGGWAQSPLDPATDEAGHLHALWNLMLAICGGVYVLVLLFLGWALWRNRRRLDAAPDADPHDGGLRLGLTAWAAFITLGLSAIAGASFLVDRALAANHPGDVLQIRVTGQQWWWRVQYRAPSGNWIETANEVHLPLNRPARIEVATTDVIHSFWIPNLAGKQDTIPGRINTLFATPRRMGWFRGQCAEFCGLQHAQMALDVKVDSPQAFEAWLSGQSRAAGPPADPVAARGQQIVTTQTCGQCHSVRGTQAQGRAAPDLTHVASRRSLAAGTLPFNRGALMGWITQPQAAKPGASPQVRESRS